MVRGGWAPPPMRRAANGDQPVGATSCRREQHTMASCQNPQKTISCCNKYVTMEGAVSLQSTMPCCYGMVLWPETAPSIVPYLLRLQMVFGVQQQARRFDCSHKSFGC